MIQINTNIAVTTYDWIRVQNIHYLLETWEKMLLFFGADMNSSVHVDNKNKDILILGERPTEGLDDMTLTAKEKYPINFTQPNKRFALSLRYNGSNSFL